MPLDLSRRGFVAGLAAALFAPAVVRAESLMPVRMPIVPVRMSVEDLLRRRMDAATQALKEGIARSLYGDSNAMPMEFSGFADLFERPPAMPFGIDNAQYTWRQIGVELIIKPELANVPA